MSGLRPRLRLEMAEVDDMMRISKASGASRHDVACDWLKSHEARWRPWIPDATACNRGFGLYDEAGQKSSPRHVKGQTLAELVLPGCFLSTIRMTRVTHTCGLLRVGM